jgi:hypothetical protein
MNHFVKYARWYWIAWVLLAFLPLELYAVFNHTPGDTFSENWWGLFGILGHVPIWWHVVGVLVTLVTGVWLTGHLAFGLWGGPTKVQLPKGFTERLGAEIREMEARRAAHGIGPLSTHEVVALVQRFERGEVGTS